jgi:hypothetical protein
MSDLKIEKITKIQFLKEEVCCDNNHMFMAKSVNLIPFNCMEHTDIGNIIYVDDDFNIRQGNFDEISHGFLMACPVCNLIHLSGFNNPNTWAVRVAGNDNIVPERKLTLEL